MNRMHIKMVAGRTYTSPSFNGKVLTRGDTVTVSEEVGKALLDDGYHDALNNFHPYFQEVDSVDGATPVARRRRSRPDDDADPEAESRVTGSRNSTRDLDKAIVRDDMDGDGEDPARDESLRIDEDGMTRDGTDPARTESRKIRATDAVNGLAPSGDLTLGDIATATPVPVLTVAEHQAENDTKPKPTAQEKAEERDEMEDESEKSRGSTDRDDPSLDRPLRGVDQESEGEDGHGEGSDIGEVGEESENPTRVAKTQKKVKLATAKPAARTRNTK